ncbi:Na+/H+ antiporter subunit E [Solwaraspora sp. WMMD791]|uniref:Na+/H+ antiporter subunit E n=1 Tax=Solwaraspora sp. WMMD791 TaxID=3016086 RepID=UPI00249CD474|nr:Na+/H+ antiporter subunit E [Solwaraspora sp. WMMD791]WFE29405.1 Na+/H+ antiporter subunit E [Solwaraspora sp. WMMD791]
MSGRGGTGWWASPPGRFALRTVRVSRFIGYFAVRLVVANLVVAREIVTPGSGLSPGIVEIRLRTRTPTEVVLMALAVGLTPGTLTVAIRQDPPTLFVHGMHAEDPQTFRAELARLQDRMLPAVRPVQDAGDRSGDAGVSDRPDRSGDAGDQGRPEVNPS